MNILDAAREIAQDTERELQLGDGWNNIFDLLGVDPETGRQMLGL